MKGREWPLRPMGGGVGPLGSPMSSWCMQGSDQCCLCPRVVRVGLSPSQGSQEPLVRGTRQGLAICILFKQMVLN